MGERDRRDRLILLLVTGITALVIVVVLYCAGAFRPSTG